MRARRPGAPWRWTTTVAAVLTAVALAGCSSNKPVSSPTSGATTSTAAHPTTSAATPTTTTTVPGCTGANYVLSVFGSEGAAGTNEVTLGLRNTASATCTLYGYPGIQLLGPGGTAIATNEVQGDGHSFTDFARSDVSLGPGATAYFNIGYSDVTSGTETSCPTTTALQVIPPNTSTELTVAGQFQVCNGGTVDVSPVFAAGSSATQTTAPPST